MQERSDLLSKGSLDIYSKESLEFSGLALTRRKNQGLLFEQLGISIVYRGEDGSGQSRYNLSIVSEHDKKTIKLRYGQIYRLGEKNVSFLCFRKLYRASTSNIQVEGTFIIRADPNITVLRSEIVERKVE